MNTENFEALTLLAWMTLFLILEKILPWRDQNPERRIFRDRLGIDVASLVLMFLGSGIMTAVMMFTFDHLLGELRRGDLAFHFQHLRWWKIVLGLLLVDFTTYWTHRMLHRVKIFKPVHRWHHTIEKLNWLSGFRTSLLHGLFFTILPQFVVPFLLLRLNPAESGLVFSIQFFFQLLAHVNIPWNQTHLFGIFVTPKFHRIHHAIDERAYNSNFAAIFSFYDRIFGTYKDPEAFDPEELSFGLGDGRSEKDRTFIENLRYMIGI